jgi:hypothetical protein
MEKTNTTGAGEYDHYSGGDFVVEEIKKILTN